MVNYCVGSFLLPIRWSMGYSFCKVAKAIRTRTTKPNDDEDTSGEHAAQEGMSQLTATKDCCPRHSKQIVHE